MILLPVASDVSNDGGWVGWTDVAAVCNDAIQFPNLWQALQDDGTQAFPYLASWCGPTETPLALELSFGVASGDGSNPTLSIRMTQNAGAGQEIYITATLKQDGITIGEGEGIIPVGGTGTSRYTVDIPITAEIVTDGELSVLFAFNLVSGLPGQILSTEIWSCLLDAELVAPPVATTIVVTPATATVKVGGPISVARQQYAAVVYDQYSVEMLDEPVTWETDDGDVATIDVNGLATGISVGSVTVTATSGAASDTAALICNSFVTVVVDPDEPPTIPDDPDPQVYDCGAIVPASPAYSCLS